MILDIIVFKWVSEERYGGFIMTKKLRLLLYCTKTKPYLFESITTKGKYMLDNDKWFNELNGKIVAECDFEVEKIEFEYVFHSGYSDVSYKTKTLNDNEIFRQSCLRPIDMNTYFRRNFIMEEKGTCGYAIHIKNLHIFDEPKELSEYGMDFPISPIVKAPQNMMYANGIGERYILISIRPQWLCKILNGEKTIEVRKKVLKEMLGLI